MTPRARTLAIVAEVAEAHRYDTAALIGPARGRMVCAARFEAMHRVREETRLSLHQIGQVFGGRDHTTVLNALERHERRMAG